MSNDGGDFYSLTGVSAALARDIEEKMAGEEEESNQLQNTEENQENKNENEIPPQDNENNETIETSNELELNETAKEENIEKVDKMSQNVPSKSSFESPGEIDSGYSVPGFNVVDDLIPEVALNMTLDLNTLTPLETPPKDLEECTKAIQLFHQKGQLPEFHLRQKVLQYLERVKVNALVKLKYSEAKEAQDDIVAITSACIAEDSEAAHAERISHYEEKIAEAEQNLIDANKETEELLKRKQKQSQEKQNQLKQHQADELDDFEQKWNDEDFLRRFAKPSNELMTLRSVERALVGGRDFLGAEEARAKIEYLEQVESETAQGKAEQSMAREQDKLLLKHQRELAAFEELAQREINDIERDGKMKRETIENRLAKLRSSLAELKKRKPLPPLPQSPASAPPESTITPRTTKRYNVYKCAARNPKITIKPLGKIAAKRRSALTKTVKI